MSPPVTTNNAKCNKQKNKGDTDQQPRFFEKKNRKRHGKKVDCDP